MAVNVLFQPPVVRRERHFRGFDPLEREFSDEELRQRYRFGRETIGYLSDLMRGDLERGTNKETALSVEQQVMIALRFYGSGSHLQVVGDTMGFDKSTVSRVIDRVTDSLVAMKDDFISWPDNQRKNVIRAGFYEKSGFPNVVGCIDGTHIRITGLSIDEPAFVNRKGFHSINVQAICDHEVFSIPKRDCSEVPRGTKSGVYCIQPDNGTEISVFCEMDIDNGGWTTIQRRYDGTVDFYRYWEDYKSGFGDIDGEHWLGNDNLHFILRQGSYRVRFDIEDFTGDTSYAIYDTIYVGDESTNYTLSITGYNGIAGHAMKDWHPNELDGMMFTTRDRDNDISPTNCGFKKQSGWWYAACSYSNINGGYGELYDTIANIYWKTWKPNALKKTRMMIKPN